MEKRHCRDIHKDPVISAKTCPLCYAFCRIPAFAQLWGSEEDPAPLSMPIPHPSPYVAPKDCRFKGEDQVPSSDLIRLGLPTTGRDYSECGKSAEKTHEPPALMPSEIETRQTETDKKRFGVRSRQDHTAWK